jgi:hypothetical protein
LKRLRKLGIAPEEPLEFIVEFIRERRLVAQDPLERASGRHGTVPRHLAEDLESLLVREDLLVPFNFSFLPLALAHCQSPLLLTGLVGERRRRDLLWL